MAGTAIEVEGLRDLQRTLAKIDKGVAKEVRGALVKAGEPIRVSAEQLAAANIGNIGPVWNRMRLGATLSGVYIAPATRRSGGSPRPNFGGLLLRQAMLPARDKYAPLILLEVERSFDKLVYRSGFH